MHKDFTAESLENLDFNLDPMEDVGVDSQVDTVGDGRKVEVDDDIDSEESFQGFVQSAKAEPSFQPELISVRLKPKGLANPHKKHHKSDR